MENQNGETQHFKGICYCYRYYYYYWYCYYCLHLLFRWLIYRSYCNFG